MCEFCGLHGAIHGDDKPLDSGFGFFSAAAIQSGQLQYAVQFLAAVLASCMCCMCWNFCLQPLVRENSLLGDFVSFG